MSQIETAFGFLGYSALVNYGGSQAQRMTMLMLRDGNGYPQKVVVLPAASLQGVL
jgi:hypothetical protein